MTDLERLQRGITYIIADANLFIIGQNLTAEQLEEWGKQTVLYLASLLKSEEGK